MLLETSDVKIKKVSEKGNTGVYSFEPLPTGFGRTLGSALRRVLLTSLKGGAVTQVKIPKVAHQFTTMPGVKEDVVEICLNLKKIRVKVHGAKDNAVIGQISKVGPGTVKAGDIVVSSDAEIINKDLHIAELADKSAKFEAELMIESGVGYSPVENKKTSKVGVILLDALFSPVTLVSYDVESARKGEVSGYDNLILTVTTDGTTKPSDAITEAATLLRNFFSRFSKGVDPEEEVDELMSTEIPTVGVSKDTVYLEDLTLPTRTINALKKHGIDTLNSLAKLSPDELSDVKNLGDKSVKEIEKLLKKEGLR